MLCGTTRESPVRREARPGRGGSRDLGCERAGLGCERRRGVTAASRADRWSCLRVRLGGSQIRLQSSAISWRTRS